MSLWRGCQILKLLMDSEPFFSEPHISYPFSIFTLPSSPCRGHQFVKMFSISPEQKGALDARYAGWAIERNSAAVHWILKVFRAKVDLDKQRQRDSFLFFVNSNTLHFLVSVDPKISRDQGKVPQSNKRRPPNKHRPWKILSPSN